MGTDPGNLLAWVSCTKSGRLDRVEDRDSAVGYYGTDRDGSVLGGANSLLDRSRAAFRWNTGGRSWIVSASFLIGVAAALGGLTERGVGVRVLSCVTAGACLVLGIRSARQSVYLIDRRLIVRNFYLTRKIDINAIRTVTLQTAWWQKEYLFPQLELQNGRKLSLKFLGVITDASEEKQAAFRQRFTALQEALATAQTSTSV